MNVIRFPVTRKTQRGGDYPTRTRSLEPIWRYVEPISGFLDDCMNIRQLLQSLQPMKFTESANPSFEIDGPIADGAPHCSQRFPCRGLSKRGIRAIRGDSDRCRPDQSL